MSINQNIAIYSDGEIELKISVDNETIWLTQKQIAELFDKDVRTINDHIKAIYNEEELFKNSTIRNFRIVQKEGNRAVSRDISHYNLDVVTSIGYRANSKKATKFCQWSTRILKEYITNGYAINVHKITEKRLLNLENDMQFVKSKITNNTVEIKQGIFYNREIFDAYLFVINLIKEAKQSLILIDNYIDETTLMLFSNNKNIKVKIYTKNISKQLLLAFEKYNKQYSNLELKSLTKFHDRFLLIDNNRLYHIGASLKDLGKKTFAFNRLNIDLVEFLGKLK